MMEYVVTVAEYDDDGTLLDYLIMGVHGDNLPTKTAIEMVDGVGRITQADRFTTLAGNVGETVLNMTENPAEVSVMRLHP
jgi:hypothetical protein